MPKALQLLTSAWKNALDLLLPPSRETRVLETMSASALFARARRAQRELPGIMSVFDYRDELITTLIWQIKFKGNKRLVGLAAEILLDVMLAELADRYFFEGARAPILLPVPLSEGRLRERGFNQTQRIAKAMFERDGGKNFSLAMPVARIKETKSQSHTASRAERIENMRGAFTIADRQKVSGEHFIILDDVSTTGCTIGEIKNVLEEAGAASVVGLTLAH